MNDAKGPQLAYEPIFRSVGLKVGLDFRCESCGRPQKKTTGFNVLQDYRIHAVAIHF